MSHEGLPGGHIAVRLQIPAAHDVPLPLGDQPPYSPKKHGIIFFDILIQKRFVVIEDKPPVLFTYLGGDTKSAQRLGRAFLPFPKPHGIQVRVANKMYTFPYHSATTLPQPCLESNIAPVAQNAIAPLAVWSVEVTDGDYPGLWVIKKPGTSLAEVGGVLSSLLTEIEGRIVKSLLAHRITSGPSMGMSGILVRSRTDSLSLPALLSCPA